MTAKLLAAFSLPFTTQLRQGNVFTPVCQPPSPDGHCNGRYASYWNAFLFTFINSTQQMCCYSYRSETSADWLELHPAAREEARVSGWVENRWWTNQQSVRTCCVTALSSHVTDQRYCGIHWTTCWTWSDYEYLQ